MKLCVLITGNDEAAIKADANHLKDRGLHTATCTHADQTNDMIEEIKPDVLFLDFRGKDAEKGTLLYNKILEDIHYIGLPIVYTLAVNDVYLVNRSRTSFKSNRYDTCDNMIDAVRESLTQTVSENKLQRLLPFLQAQSKRA